MDGAKFSKLCKDAKLVGRGLSPTDVDLIFMKVKARGERRITFDQVPGVPGRGLGWAAREMGCRRGGCARGERSVLYWRGTQGWRGATCYF
jgi:hypothetical protein